MKRLKKAWNNLRALDKSELIRYALDNGLSIDEVKESWNLYADGGHIFDGESLPTLLMYGTRLPVDMDKLYTDYENGVLKANSLGFKGKNAANMGIQSMVDGLTVDAGLYDFGNLGEVTITGNKPNWLHYIKDDGNANRVTYNSQAAFLNEKSALKLANGVGGIIAGVTAPVYLGPALGELAALDGAMTAASPIYLMGKGLFNTAMTVDGIHNLFTDNGVAKTKRLWLNDLKGKAILSGVGDVLDVLPLFAGALKGAITYRRFADSGLSATQKLSPAFASFAFGASGIDDFAKGLVRTPYGKRAVALALEDTVVNTAPNARLAWNNLVHSSLQERLARSKYRLGIDTSPENARRGLHQRWTYSSVGNTGRGPKELSFTGTPLEYGLGFEQLGIKPLNGLVMDGRALVHNTNVNDYTPEFQPILRKYFPDGNIPTYSLADHRYNRRETRFDNHDAIFGGESMALKSFRLEEHPNAFMIKPTHEWLEAQKAAKAVNPKHRIEWQMNFDGAGHLSELIKDLENNIWLSNKDVDKYQPIDYYTKWFANRNNASIGTKIKGAFLNPIRFELLDILDTAFTPNLVVQSPRLVRGLNSKSTNYNLLNRVEKDFGVNLHKNTTNKKNTK